MTQRETVRKSILRQELTYGVMPMMKSRRYQKALDYCQNGLNFHHDKSGYSWEQYLEICVVKMRDHYNNEVDKKINEELELS